MTVSELLNRKLIDYGETMTGVSIACGFAPNEIQRIMSGRHMEIRPGTRCALCRHFDIAQSVLDAAIEEGRNKAR